jgi:arginyl-tRNA synthetase
LTYATTDLATIYDRAKNLHADKIIYVVDKRQALHFKQIFELTSKTSWSDVKLEHVEFGTLNGKDGKPFKTREGGVMRLEDLFELTKSKVLEKMRDKESISAPEEIASIIGLAAIKFADLSKYRLTDYVFDIDQFTEFHGKTGPYLIYSCVRLKSILSKAQERNYTLGSAINLVHIREVRDLLLNMTKFYHFLQKAKAENSPHYLCDYIYNLAQSFSSLYSAVEILAEKDQNVRGSLLALCQLVLCNMEETLLLLGIDATKIEAM